MVFFCICVSVEKENVILLYLESFISGVLISYCIYYKGLVLYLYVGLGLFLIYVCCGWMWVWLWLYESVWLCGLYRYLS